MEIGPRLAIWGTFDLANFGDHLFPRLFENEMRQRLPDAEIQPFSPLGHLHPVPFDGGLIVEPLGEWSSQRLKELSDGYDLVAIGGGEIVHTEDASYAHYYDLTPEEAEPLRPSEFFIGGLGSELEQRHAVAWHSVGIPFDLDDDTAERVRTALERRAYVSVRDEISRDRLLRIGIEREVMVAPDSAFLVDRLFPQDLLERRLAHLRRIGAYPDRERPLVVQGSRALVPSAAAIGRALAAALEEVDAPVVLLEAGPCHGDSEFADALQPFLEGRFRRMPEGSTVEDIVAAITHSRGFIGISLHGNIIAAVSGLPNAVLNFADYSKLDGFARLADREETLVTRADDVLPAVRRVLAGGMRPNGLSAIAARVDRHFDTLAEIAERSVRNRLQASLPGHRSLEAEAVARAQRREQLLQRAFEARGRRLLAERLRLRGEIERVREGAAQQLTVTEMRIRDEAAQQLATAETTIREEAAQQLATAETTIREEAAQQLAASEARLAESRAEVQRLVASRTVRYTAPLRAILRAFRHSKP